MRKNIQELLKITDEYLIQLPEFRVKFDLPVKNEIAKFIDHTLLKAEATEEQIKKLCQEAKVSQFATVCLNPSYVPLAATLLKGTSVKVCTVIGFPLGANSTYTKVAESLDSIDQGADEIDMVINIGAIRGGDYQLVYDEILQVKEAAGETLVKVIFENCYLDKKEKILCCLMCIEAGVEFVKTSTGFGTSGATLEDVELMRRVVGPTLGVKAAGGIRTYTDAMNMIRAGADRLGSSAGVAILAES
jgi:deoxyribose-phosphate aldolase